MSVFEFFVYNESCCVLLFGFVFGGLLFVFGVLLFVWVVVLV